MKIMPPISYSTRLVRAHKHRNGEISDDDNDFIMTKKKKDAKENEQRWCQIKEHEDEDYY